MIEQLQVTLVWYSYFYKKKKQAQYKINILHYCSKGDRYPSRLMAGGTQGHLDLECDPLIHMKSAARRTHMVQYLIVNEAQLDH